MQPLHPKPDKPEPKRNMSFRPEGEILASLEVKSKISPFGRNDHYFSRNSLSRLNNFKVLVTFGRSSKLAFGSF
jgi:hypothetical protein